MRVKKKLLASACAIAVFGAVGIASAADRPSGNVPGTQGLDSVDKNLNRDSDSRGLTNAQSHIQDNIGDRAARKKAAHKPVHKAVHKAVRNRDAKGVRVEKAERMDSPARPDHPERPGR